MAWRGQCGRLFTADIFGHWRKVMARTSFFAALAFMMPQQMAASQRREWRIFPLTCRLDKKDEELLADRRVAVR